MKNYIILPVGVLFILFFIAPFCYSQITDPRAWAEWEETDGIIIHQPNFYPEQNPSPVELLVAEEWDSLYAGLIRGLFEEGVKIYYIIDTNDRPEYHSAILDTMQARHGINISHPDFHVVIGCKEDYSHLDKWTRDHGPMNIYKDGTDSLYFYLFNDDYRGAGGIIRDYLGVPDSVFYNPASGTTASDGGNYIVDGYSIGIINGGAGAVLPELKGYFGLDTVYALPDYLEHADYYMKMLNEETMIISAQQPENYIFGTEPYTYAEDSVILKNMVAFFQVQVISQYGRPLQVFQVPNPPSLRNDSLQLIWYTHYASYTNSLIVNRSLFVPQFNLPGSDSTAIEIYREAMPGYKIVPVFCRRGATAGGAVHCLTNSVAAREPVLIRHTWYRDTVEQAPGYEIAASIMTRSGIKKANVFWSNFPGGPFQPVIMQNISGDLYSATIPRQEGVNNIYYYITAESNSGKTGIKPIVAPGYTYNISIRGGAPGWISHLTNKKNLMKIYPNPATTYLTIDLSCNPLDPGKTLRLNLYDLMGKTILHQVISSSKNVIEINLSSIRPGQYFLVLIEEEGEFCFEKLIISR